MLNYNSLFELYKKEEQSNKIEPLPENFEADLKTLIENLYTRSDLESKKELENIKIILNSIMCARLEKIALRAIRSSILDLANLSENEKKFFSILTKYVQEQKNTIEMLVSKEQKKLIKILILKDVEEYISQEGKIIGPFKNGQILEIEQSEALWLKENGLASIL